MQQPQGAHFVAALLNFLLGSMSAALGLHHQAIRSDAMRCDAMRSDRIQTDGLGLGYPLGLCSR